MFDGVLQTGAIALLDAQYLIELAKAGGRLCRRQQLPKRAFIALPRLKEVSPGYALPVVCISYLLLTATHPDPKGDHLRLIAELLEIRLDASEALAAGDKHFAKIGCSGIGTLSTSISGWAPYAHGRRTVQAGPRMPGLAVFAQTRLHVPHDDFPQRVSGRLRPAARPRDARVFGARLVLHRDMLGAALQAVRHVARCRSLFQKQQALGRHCQLLAAPLTTHHRSLATAALQARAMHCPTFVTSSHCNRSFSQVSPTL